MATFVPIAYTYVPTAPRSKSSTARRKPAPKQSSILDKLQHIKSSSTSLNTARTAAARRGDDIRGGRLGIRETDTVKASDDDSDDDDSDLPSIEQLLYTTLQKEGFAAEDQRLNNTTFGVGDAIAEEGSGSYDDNNGSALGDNSGGSPDDPIVLLGDDDSSASETEVDDDGRAESVGADAGLFDSLENAADLTTLAPPSSDVWHDIHDFPKTSQRLRLAQQGASAPDSTHFPLPRLSSEPLHDSIGAVDLNPRRARSEATTSCSARIQTPPLRCATVLSENQLSHNSRLHTSRGVVHERGLVDPARNADPLDEREQQQQEEDEDYDNEAGSHSHSGDKLNKTEPDEDGEEPHPIKRKRPASSQDGPMHKKPKPRLQQRSKPRGRSPKSHSPFDQGSTVAPVSSTKGRLPSSPLSAPRAVDTDMSPDCCNFDRLSSVALPTLTEVTFRPHSPHCCSFTAVIRDGCAKRGVSLSQVVRLIASIGYIGKINDFTIRPVEQQSFLLTGFSRPTSSRPSFVGATLSTAEKAGRDHVHAMRTRPQEGRAVDVGALASRKSKPSISDNDGGLSDSDSESSSEDDGCSSEDEQGLSSTSKHSRWSDLDEQRLLAYKKEHKSWDWIFKKFPGRSRAAVRTRWTMVQRKVS